MPEATSRGQYEWWLRRLGEVERIHEVVRLGTVLRCGIAIVKGREAE
jgi:hypothetical protein